MVFDFQSRLATVRRIWAHRWVRAAITVWGIVCFYDTLLSQIIPASLGERFPKVRELIAMTSGFLPFWVWLLVLGVIATAASFEYAFRRTSGNPPRNVSVVPALPEVASKPFPDTAPAPVPVVNVASPEQPQPRVAKELEAPIKQNTILQEVYREDWETGDVKLDVLYGVAKQVVYLKFASDSVAYMRDHLLLILFGYKKILNVSDLPYDVANRLLGGAERLVPGRSISYSPALDLLVNPPNAAAIAQDNLHDCVDCHRLAEGGRLRLTPRGYRLAYNVAQDLIDRAGPRATDPPAASPPSPTRPK